MTQHDQLSAKALYELAYKSQKANDNGKVMEICEILLLKFPSSDEAKWAIERFKIDFGTFIQKSLPVPPTHPIATRPLAILLSRYIDKAVGITYLKPKEYSPAILSQVTDDFLSVRVPDKHIIISYPLHHVLNITEAEGGVSAGVFFEKRYVALIDVFHLVVYSGAVGISIPIPIG